MIMPSSVHIAKAADLKTIPLPSQQLQSTEEQRIELVDHEVSAEKDSTPNGNGDISTPSISAPSTAATRLTRKDAIIDKTDKMCASGKSTQPGD